MKPENHASRPTVAPAAERDMKRTRPLRHRLLAVAVLWPVLALGQTPAPAPATETASGPAPAAAEPAPAAASEAKPASGAEAAPAAAAEAKPAAAAETVEYSKKGADTCLTCHDDAHVMAIFKTRHGNPNDARSPFGKGQLQCEACHGPGGNHTKKIKKGETRTPMIRFSRDSAAPVAVQNGVCLTCHQKSHERQLARRSARRQQRHLRRLPRPALGQGPGPGARDPA